MTTTVKTTKRRGEGANYQFLPEELRKIRTVSPKEKRVLGFIISKCINSDIYDNAGCMAVSYDKIMKGGKVKRAEDVQYIIKSLKARGYITYIPGRRENEANRYTLSRSLTDMINKDEKKINYIPADDKKDTDMTPEQPQPAPAVENIDYKQKYDSLVEKYNSLVARSKKWINDLSGMDSGEDGGKYIEEAVKFYREHTSGEQPQQPVPQTTDDKELQRLRDENKQLKTENEEYKEKYNDLLFSNKLVEDNTRLYNENEELKKEVARYKNAQTMVTEETVTEYGNVKKIKYN